MAIDYTAEDSPLGDEYGPDIVSVVDENGEEHIFEELDRIETDDGKFVALIPAFDDAEAVLDDDGELIILRVSDDDSGETYLEPIEDGELFNSIGSIFEERLSDIFEFEDEE